MMLGFTLDYIGYNWKLQLSPEPVQAQELPVPPADIPGQPTEN
jgi:hypothetical protein